MKPTLFIVGGSSTALEIRETVDQFFKDNILLFITLYQMKNLLFYKLILETRLY